MTAYHALDPSKIRNSEAHRQLALEAAKAGVILLKNEKETLPLTKSLKKLLVVGPLANDTGALTGETNYAGSGPYVVTHLEGIMARAQTAGVTVEYRNGSLMRGDGTDLFAVALRDAAIAAAKDSADAVVAVLGHDCSFEK